MATNMTNAALKALVAEMGDRIFAICLDNGHKVFCGINARNEDNIVYASQLEYKTVEGVDMFGVKHVDHTWGSDAIEYHVWFVTSFIQFIYATDELTTHVPDLTSII